MFYVERKEREVRDKAAEDDDDDVVLDEAGLSTRDLFKNVAAEHEVTLSRSSLNTPSARRRALLTSISPIFYKSNISQLQGASRMTGCYRRRQSSQCRLCDTY